MNWKTPTFAELKGTKPRTHDISSDAGGASFDAGGVVGAATAWLFLHKSAIVSLWFQVKIVK